MNNEDLLQEEIDKNAIITAAGRGAQVVYLKGGNSGVNNGAGNCTEFIADADPEAVVIPGPFTFGRQIPVDIDIKKDGVWSENETHRHWKLVIRSPNAYSLNLLFDKFRLPEEAELYVHDLDGKVNLGAFTAEISNKDDLKFATTPVPGNVLVLEYFEPLACHNEDLLLHVKGIVHAFRNIFAVTEGENTCPHTTGEISEKIDKNLTGISGSCNINVACPLGDGWRDQIRSVVVFMTAEGQKFCSGAMINNALQNGKQYFLTANHCVDDPNTDYRYSILGFNFQAASCVASPSSHVAQAAHGLILKAKLRNSDFALFELTERIPDSYNVYMAGWSAGKTVPPGTCCGVHHPSGDQKKISTTFGTITPDCWTECPRRWHWRVNRWEKGVTEPGSSGSPLFSPQKLIIGQLHGGGSSCDNPLGYDVYGAIHASYNSGLVASQRLIDWLNPKKNPRITSVPGANLNDIRAKGLDRDSMEDELAMEVAAISE